MNKAPRFHLRCRMRRFGLILLVWMIANGAVGQVYINEILASNRSGLMDGQGDYDDWIELYNAGDTAVDLAGMFLTDTLSEPMRYQFPTGQASQTTLAAGGYLIIWADNEVWEGLLHAGFGLASAGGAVALFQADGQTIVDSIVYGEQWSDLSYGRSTDGAADFRYFAPPSPNAPNTGGYLGVVGDTKFSVDRGFFNAPFTVEITCQTEGAVIHYTLDASTPSDASPVYSGPVTIDGTTCLRAVAVKTGWRSSDVDTQTYIFPAQVLTQTRPSAYPDVWGGGYPGDYDMDPDIVNNAAYSAQMEEALLAIPSMSIVTDRDYLFAPGTNPATSGIYMNTTQEGELWERPTSFEMIDPQGKDELQINCGLRIQGGASRQPEKCPKHSFRLLFKGIYGPTKLDHSMFGREANDAFDTLILRAGFNNSWNHWSGDQRPRSTYITDEFIRRLQLEMGQVASHGRMAHLYVNGLYWGLYNMVERPQASFAAAYYGGEKEEWDALNSAVAVDGDTVAWNTAMTIANGGVTEPAGYVALSQYVDIPNLADFMLVEWFGGNWDWDDHNWYAARRRIEGAGYKFFTWDSERTLEGLNDNRIGVNQNGRPSRITAQLRQNPDFRLLVADHAHRHLFNSGALTPERMLEIWTELRDTIGVAILGESARWGDYRRDVHPWSSGPYELYTRDDFWLPEMSRILTQYLPNRPGVFLNQLRSSDLYPGHDAPVFTPHGGAMGEPGATVTIANPGGVGTIYYTTDGSDPRVWYYQSTTDVDVIPFLSEAATKRVHVPTGTNNAWFSDLAFDDSGWIQGTGGVGYDFDTNYLPFFNIDIKDQLYNVNTACWIRIPFDLTAEDIDGLRSLQLKIRFDDGFFAMLNGLRVADGYAPELMRWDSAALAARSDSLAVTPTTFDISNYIDRLQVGTNLLAIQGMNNKPSSSDFLITVALEGIKGDRIGNMPSESAQEYTGPIVLDESIHLQSRVLVDGQWSALNEATYSVGSVFDDLVITELMFNPADGPLGSVYNNDEYEFIELKNIGELALNLSGLTFSDGIVYTFPLGTILEAGAYMLLVSNQAAFESRYGMDLPVVGQYDGSLSNSGETVRLDSGTSRVVSVTFSDGRGWPLAADGTGHSMVAAPSAWPLASQGALDYGPNWRDSVYVHGSPGADEPVAPVSVVLNEVSTHTDVDAPPYDSNDWIELFNPSDQTVTLRNYYLSDDGDDLRKWAIPETTVAAGAWVSFDEMTGFHNPITSGFGLNKAGEDIFLSHLPGDASDRVVDSVRLKGQENDIALGRYGDGAPWWGVMTPTRDGANALPAAALMISELMYHPLPSATYPTSDSVLEYIEIFNPTSQAVSLSDGLMTWRLNGGVEYEFPVGASLGAGEYLLVLGFDPADAAARSEFQSVYGAAAVSAPLYGPFRGVCSNQGERIALEKPIEPDLVGDPPVRVIVDEVYYFDRTPWPLEADGSGQALRRIESMFSGMNPSAWIAADPTPGVQPAPLPKPARSGWYVY